MDAETARSAFLDLQTGIRESLIEADSACRIQEDEWERKEGGGGRTWAFAKGNALEKGGINFSDVFGDSLPPSASLERPELTGLPFRAMGVSVVFHPYNPFVPTSHANVRFLQVGHPEQAVAWWFGGGFDLTPFYPFKEDVILWHQSARSACDPYGIELYPRFKRQCDEYFYLPHRGETRGVGGLFFDDLNLGGFEQTLQFVIGVGIAFRNAYFEIFNRRSQHPFGEKERNFQKYRRGRYVEFNLVYDRGTHFGLQSGGRTESILMSMPPEVSWGYGWNPEPGSKEARLYDDFLRPREWLEESK